jgi:hypothetical protein
MKVHPKRKLCLTTDINTLSDTARSYIEEHKISLIPHTLNLDYNFWTAGTESLSFH